MSKNLNIVVLLDFYGQLLTEKQREVLELYYNEDLSLAEIAQNTGSITRQGVRDSIKRGEATLLEMEEKLGLVGKMDEMRGDLLRIAEISQGIRLQNDRFRADATIERGTREIEQLVGRLRELSD